MTLLLNCSLPRDSMSQLTPSALSNPSGAIHQEMRSKGFQLTRFADDWVITCHSEAEAHAAIAAALRILKEFGSGTPSAEDAGCPRPARFRVSWLQDQTWKAVKAFRGQDPRYRKVRGVVCVSPREVDSPLHGWGTRAHQATRAA